MTITQMLSAFAAFFLTSIGPALADGPAIDECDRLAGASSDSGHVTTGIPLNQIDSRRAIAACDAAVARNPENLRFHFEYGRALIAGHRFDNAITQLRIAADKQYPAAEGYLGYEYTDGEGVPKDAGEAMRWFRRAAEHGNSDAQYNLGYIYYTNARGLSDDRAALAEYSQAAQWFQKAADQGDARAEDVLKVLAKNGVVPTERTPIVQAAQDQPPPSVSNLTAISPSDRQATFDKIETQRMAAWRAGDHAQVFELYQQEAALGDQEAVANVCMMAMNDRSLVPDASQGRAICAEASNKRAAAEKRYADAQAQGVAAAEKQAEDEKQAAVKADAAEDAQYQKDLKVFRASFSRRKDIGDNVCGESDGLVGDPEQVENVHGDKIQIRRYVAGSRIGYDDGWGGTNYTNLPGSDHLFWIRYDDVGFCEYVTPLMKRESLIHGPGVVVRQILKETREFFGSGSK